MNKCILNVILVLFFIFFSIPVIAAEENDAKHEEAVTMPEVVVVASPIIEGNQVNDSGSQVTIVQQKQISDLNAQDLPSALRRTPGVVISRYNPVGSFGGDDGGAVYIRGMGSSRPGAECTSSNGFGQIRSGTKRWFQHSYKPFLPFRQASKSDSVSFVKASYFV